MSHDQANLNLPPPIHQENEPMLSEQQHETAQHTNGSTGQTASLTDNLINSAKQAMDNVQNHPATQNAKDTIVNGPVGQTVQDQSAKTSSEFKDLANSRQTPDKPAATGQPLTHYHSMFYRLLSWKNPRATGITFVTTIAFIFAARYLNIMRYALKGLYMVLGVTAAAEIAGQAVLGDGLATKMRPRKYFVIPKESLERFTDDAEQLINFFVIEFQRVLFAENIWVTLLAFFSSFISYWLIKWLPLWGLTLIFDTLLFLGPLIYIKNQAFIDEHLSNAKKLAADQANQVRDLAAQHTGRATESVKAYTSEYTKKAQEALGQTKAKAQNTASNVKASDFPSAPKEEPVAKADEPAPVPAA